MSHFDTKRAAQSELRAIYAAAAGRELNAAEVDAEARAQATIERADRLIEADAAKAAASVAFRNHPVSGSFEGRNIAKGDRFVQFVEEARSTGRASLELELRDDVALTAGVATDGAELVPTLHSSEIQRLLVEGSPVIPAVRSITTDGGQDLVMPKVVSHSDVAVVAEGGTIPRSAPQFATVTLGAVKAGALMQASRELLEDAAGDVVGVMLEQAARSMARFIETEVCLGANFTNGIFDATSNAVTVAGTASVTTDELLDIYHALPVPARAGASWVISDNTAKAIRSLKDADNNYLWQPGLVAGQPATLLGRPVIVAADVADMATGAKFAAFGDLSAAYVLRRVNSIHVDYSSDFALDTDMGTWRIVGRFDGALVDESQIVVASNA